MNKQENWYAVEVEILEGNEEAIEFALNELDSLGNEINQLGKMNSENVTVVGYFNELPGEEILQNTLTEALRIYGFPADSILRIKTKEIENQDWLAEWKKHWRATETENFIISPPWENIENTEKIVVKIEPNMAFGTGTHETTRLCLRAIEENYESGAMTFFDVGTGTGILAIAVAKIQTKSKKEKVIIVGCDVDEDSVKIAKENAVLNEVAEFIEFYAGSISESSGEFDFICANVTADVIIPLLPLLIGNTKQILVLSGILVGQKEEVLKELEKFEIKDTLYRLANIEFYFCKSNKSSEFRRLNENTARS